MCWVVEEVLSSWWRYNFYKYVNGFTDKKIDKSDFSGYDTQYVDKLKTVSFLSRRVWRVRQPDTHIYGWNRITKFLF